MGLFTNKRKQLSLEEEKEKINKELAFYKEQELLKIEIEIQERKQGNWEDLEEVRKERICKMDSLNKEISLLEAKAANLRDKVDVPNLRIKLRGFEAQSLCYYEENKNLRFQLEKLTLALINFKQASPINPVIQVLKH